jgi:hypothetical protein
MKKPRNGAGFKEPATALLPNDEHGQRTAATPPDRAPGPPRGNTNAKRHGYYSLARRLKGAGLRKNDGRSALERIKRDWKAGIRSARGGDLSPQQEVLLETAANTWLLLGSVDSWLLDQTSLVNRRRRELFPVVQQRAGLVRNLREILGDLGLERVPVPRDPLAVVLARKYAARDAVADDRGDGMDASEIASPGAAEGDGGGD